MQIIVAIVTSFAAVGVIVYFLAEEKRRMTAFYDEKRRVMAEKHMKTMNDLWKRFEKYSGKGPCNDSLRDAGIFIIEGDQD